MRNIDILCGRYWRVKIIRHGIKYQVIIPFHGDRAAALERAIVERDRFYAAHGKNSPRSNTGIAGISEVASWARNQCRMAFSVGFGSYHTRLPRRFYYRGLAGRETALRQAVAYRARLSGENPAELLAQAIL